MADMDLKNVANPTSVGQPDGDQAVVGVRSKDHFIEVFACPVLITVSCGLMMGALAIWGPNPQPAPISSLFDTLKYGFTMGMLSLFGMLRVKSAGSPNQ